MKKRFVRPQIQVEVIEDINEPVYMACSGSNWFKLDVTGYQHQTYEDGRADARFQISGHKVGGPALHNQDLYLYLTFDQAVNIALPTGWKFQQVASDGPNSYTVAIMGNIDVLNETDNLGFGDFIVTMEQNGVTGSTLKAAWLSISGPESCM